MQSLQKEIENLRVIYKEIICGFSFISSKNLYIKHFNELESSEQLRKKIDYFEQYRSEGVPSEEEKLSQLLECGAWKKEDEEKIVTLQYTISDNEKNLKNIIIPQQPIIQKIIDDNKKELNNILIEKKMIMGSTAEEFANRQSLYNTLEDSFFKDEKLSIKFFPNGLDELEIEEIDSFAILLQNTFKKFNEDNIRKISVLPFFLTPFSYSKESIYEFIGKPISLLTPYQILLLSLGNRNLNVLNNAEGSPPELIGDVKIDDLLLWFDRNYSVMLGKRNAKTTS